MSDPLIHARDITVIRQGKKILDAVSLPVHPKDFLTIVGPNGAGKTMLLKCLMRLERPDSGSVHAAAGLRVGYVPQRFQRSRTIPISVRRFLTLGYRCQGWEEAARDVGVDQILDMPLHALSEGQMQNVLLARALMGDPQLLVMDEPAQNLDVRGQMVFYRLLNRLYAQRHVAIVMVSHDIHLVMASTKKVICLFHHICCSGEPRTVTQDPVFIDLFGKDMARMMAAYPHSHDHSHDGGSS